MAATILIAIGMLAWVEPDLALRELQRFECAEAKQGVAVDAEAFYAITNRSIGKYDKSNGRRLLQFTAVSGSPIQHLNSGVVVGDRLYCANSNWPKTPLKNSVEIFDTKTMRHLRRQVFPETEGAINWIQRRDDAWWIVFAFYGQQVRRTRLVRYDDQWKVTKTWSFPETVTKRFLPNSNSGGAFGPDGRLYVTGHDHAEVYVLRVPDSMPPGRDNVLRSIETLPAPIAGQGIAWDPAEPKVLYGIVRKSSEVIKMKLVDAAKTQRIPARPQK